MDKARASKSKTGLWKVLSDLIYRFKKRERGFPKSDNNINNLDELPTKSCEAGRKKFF